MNTELTCTSNHSEAAAAVFSILAESPSTSSRLSWSWSGPQQAGRWQEGGVGGHGHGPTQCPESTRAPHELLSRGCGCDCGGISIYLSVECRACSTWEFKRLRSKGSGSFSGARSTARAARASTSSCRDKTAGTVRLQVDAATKFLDEEGPGPGPGPCPRLTPTLEPDCKLE